MNSADSAGIPGAEGGACHTGAHSAVQKYRQGAIALHTLPLGILFGKKGPHSNRYPTA